MEEASSAMLTEWETDIKELYRPTLFAIPQLRLVPAGNGSVIKNIGSYIKISKDLLGCDVWFRRALLAHEAGHHRWGHGYFDLGFVSVAVSCAFLLEFVAGPSSAAQLCYVLLMFGLWGVMWQKWEYVADDYAVGRVGADDVVDMLMKLKNSATNSFQKQTIKRRIQRIPLKTPRVKRTP